MVESCESLAKSPNLSFFPVKFPFEIRFTAAQRVSRINKLLVSDRYILSPPSVISRNLTPQQPLSPHYELLNPAGCIIQKGLR